MKLYQLNLSPYTARVRLICYAKGLDIEFAEPPGFRTDAYKAVNPVGKIPALELDDGTVLPESEVICEYLEDRFPEPPLRPTDPLVAAKARLLARMVDLYVVPAMAPLFGQLQAAEKDQQIIADGISNARTAFGYLEHYIGQDGFAAGGALSHADGALIGGLFFATSLLPLFGLAEPLAETPKLAAYWQAIQKDTIGARLIGELGEALKAAMGG